MNLNSFIFISNLQLEYRVLFSFVIAQRYHNFCFK